jgi:NADPH:quinone reductase
MRAIGMERFESGPVVLDVAVPKPGPGEVLVKVRSASINGMDVAVAGGVLKDMMEHRFPVILGKDFAGSVEDTGPGVSGYKAGDEVFGTMPMKEFIGDGTFAEYAIISEDNGIAKIPPDLERSLAGALGLAGTAAAASIDAIAPSAGETVLISGATGGVGAIAIQLATQRGAEVIATARPGEAAEFVKDLGASHTIDFTGNIAEQVRSIRPDGVDAAVHLAGDGPRLADLVRPNGRFASTLGIGPDQLGDKGVHATAVMAMQTPESLHRLATDVAAGKLRVPVRRTYALQEVPKAISDFAAGSLGKFGVTINA